MLPTVKVDDGFARLNEALVLAPGVVFFRVTQRTLPGIRELVHFTALVFSEHILTVVFYFVFIVRATQQLFLQVLGLGFFIYCQRSVKGLNYVSALGECAVLRFRDIIYLPNFSNMDPAWRS